MISVRAAASSVLSSALMSGMDMPRDAEPADDVCVIDLAGVVEAVAGVGVDVGWFENADVVVVP